MLLPTPKEVLHSQYEVARSKTVTCRSRTDRQTHIHTDIQSNLHGSLCEGVSTSVSNGLLPVCLFPVKKTTKSLRDLDKNGFGFKKIYISAKIV